MSRRYNQPTGDRLARAEELFHAMSTAGDLLRPSPAGDDNAGTVPFSALYAYATDPDGAVDDELELALGRDPGLAADFGRILEKTVVWRLPRVAAASSGPIMSREGEGCRIRFQTSRAEPDQTYIIIELTEDGAKGPTALFIVDPELGCRRFALPAARDRVIQLLVDRDSELLQGLLDIKTEVFLR